MDKTAFSFNIGQFECQIISDGYIKVPDPPPQISSGQTEIRHGEIIDVNCLFINSGNHKILVDTGCGEGFQATAGKLVQNLEAAGIKRSEIDTIIYSHGHLDHVGGSFEINGGLVFPNARYMVSEKEWECWVTKPERSQIQRMFAGARKNLLPIPEQFQLVKDKTEVLPGIKLQIAPGHTPGNSLLDIFSSSDNLLCVADMIHSSLEFTHPEYYTFLDVYPEQAVQTRNQILSEVSKSGRLIFACHMPFPGLGFIKQKADSFSWQPFKEG
jgi:glyoxylase-like metal-dependent hydrolase (beta-lactamase superfamily II)